jgi:hypothetical protein
MPIAQYFSKFREHQKQKLLLLSNRLIQVSSPSIKLVTTAKGTREQ